MTADLKKFRDAKFSELQRTLEGIEHLWIRMHDGPDPDCMGAALGLQQLLDTKLKCSSTIVAGGYVQRPDNLAMVNMLNIDIEHPGSIKFPPEAPFLCLDTQPGSAKNTLPEGARLIGIIDHHISNTECEAPFIDIRPEFGACASIIALYILSSDAPVHKRIATALSFAIAAETRDMERVKKHIEVDVYAAMLAKADLPILGQLKNPKVERDYVSTLFKALDTAQLFDSEIAVCHLSKLPRKEDLARIADFLEQMLVVKWVLCTEVRDGRFLMSLRSSNRDAECEVVVQRLVGGDEGGFGGHGMMAGGAVRRKDSPENDPGIEPEELTRRFLQALDRPGEVAVEPLLAGS